MDAGKGYLDLSRYFQGSAANPALRVLYDPRSGQISYQKLVGSGRLANWVSNSNFDPGQFYGKKFASQYGLQGGANTDFKSFTKQIEKTYGLSMGDVLSLAPTDRQAVYNKQNVLEMDALFDPETGLPVRPPKSPEEALQFQFRADQEARKQNLGMVKNALSTLRYGLGAATRGGPHSAYSMMSPLLGQMAQTYFGTQFERPDYSYFLRSDVPGYGGQRATHFMTRMPTRPGITGGVRPGHDSDPDSAVGLSLYGG